MDRKLRDIERELAEARPATPTAAAQPAEAPAAPPAHAHAPAEAEPAAAGEMVTWPLSAAAAARRPARPESGAAAATRRPARPEGGGAARPPAAEADAIIADAHSEAARIVGDAAAQVEAMSRQVEELRGVHEQLQSAIEDLLTEHGRVVERRRAIAAVPAAATVDGDIVLSVGPFADVAALSGFEQALADLPGVAEVQVRGFAGNRALVDLRTDRPVDLAEELDRALNRAFKIVEARPGALTIDLEG